MAMLVAGAMVLSAVGCGQNADSGQSSGGQAAQETETQAKTQTDTRTDTQTEAPAAEEAAEADGVAYPLTEDVTLTMAVVANAAISANYPDISETPFWKAWQEKTGVKLELIPVQDNEALKLLFASGELPDIIYGVNLSTVYAGGPSRAVTDQVVLPLNDYMQYAPDLAAILDSNENYRKVITTEEGSIIGFPFIAEDEYLLTSQGIIIREDWLEDLGMEKPETPDELYEVLKAFKEKKGAEIPMSCDAWAVRTLLEYGNIASGFGLPGTRLYQVEGTVHYGYAEPEYKDALAYMHKLYEEGLLDPNFATLEKTTLYANMYEGRTGLTHGAAGSSIGTYMNEMKQTHPDSPFSVTGSPTLAANKGERGIGRNMIYPVSGSVTFITPQCKNIEAAVKFLNYGYTQEGHDFFNFGVEGESYTVEEGKRIYTDWITSNPDGWTMQQALAAYTRSWLNGPFVQDRGYMEQYAALPQQQEAINTWIDNDGDQYIMPPVTVTAADNAEYARISTEISTYVNEMQIKYITGAESLDTFETDYLPTLEALGVDRYIELTQNALDAFNAR